MTQAVVEISDAIDKSTDAVYEPVLKCINYFLIALFALPTRQLAPLSKAKSLAFSIGPVKILNHSLGYA
jgi:hypothetical protein